TNAIAAPLAICGVQPLADTAFVASKIVGMDFPKRSHLLYSASFALIARAILDCRTCQIWKKTASKLEAKCNSLNRYIDSRFPNRSVASPCDQLRKLSRAGAVHPAASPHARVVKALHRPRQREVRGIQVPHRKLSGLNPLPSTMLLRVPIGIGLLPCMATITCR